MKIEFDPAKSERNARDRALPFSRAAEFEWETARYWEDVRRSYSEPRLVALGYLTGRLHVMCYTPISGGIRVISLRKANAREARRYAQEAFDQ